VDGDEGVIGIMALHIMTRGTQPIFFYGQAYGGGAALEAYLAVIPFILLGATSISLKLVALCTTMVTLALTYFFCMRYCSHRMALVAVSLLAVATPLAEWHTKMRGGYAGLLLFTILILLVYARITYDRVTYGGKWHGLSIFILGFFSGLAYYNKALILPLLAALILASVCWRKSLWRWQSLILLILGVAAGTAPLIKYEIAHNFENTRFVFSRGTTDNISLLSNIFTMLTKYLPAFFVGRNVDQYIITPPVQAWVEYLIYAALLGYILFTHRKSFYRIFTAWLPGKYRSKNQNPPKPESLLVLSVFIHLAVCTVSRNTTLSPRYFLQLFPALSISAASAIDKMWQKNSKIITVLATTIFVVLISSGIITHTTYIKPSTVTDDVLLADGRIVNVQTSGDAAGTIATFLQQRGITHVRSSYFIQWRIIFESQEAVIASSHGFIPGLNRFPEYDERVNQAQSVALIYHKDSAQLYDYLQKAAAVDMYQAQIYDYVVFYPPTY
jgi:4-amino-4-deoxy-L-arabinose transferase-like glycosyltransferase